MRMNNRAFTLFTALLSIVLISLTWLLMSSMTNSERSTTSTIDDIKQHDEMQSIIDLQRADAMQVFNFNLRKTTEEYFTALTGDDLPINAFLMDDSIGTWEDVTDEFSRFFATSGSGPDAPVQRFAATTAQHLSNLVEMSPDVRGYAIGLANYAIDCSSGPCEMKPTHVAQFKAIMQTTFESQLATDSFLEYISCPSGSYSSCKGTFYINMDLGESILTEEEYQKLPKIKITHRRSGRTLIEPILPRGVFRIYMPIRYFKALSGGFELAAHMRQAAFRSSVTALEGTGDNCTAAAADLRSQLEPLVQGHGNSFVSSHVIEDAGEFEIVRESSGGVFAKVSMKTRKTSPTDDPCTVQVSSYEALLVYEEMNSTYTVYSDAATLHRYGVLIQEKF